MRKNNTKNPYSAIAKILGKRGGIKAKGKTSDKKKISSPINGRLGGRPRTVHWVQLEFDFNPQEA